MAALQKLMKPDGVLRSDLLQSFLSSASPLSSLPLSLSRNDNPQVIDNAGTRAFNDNKHASSRNITSQTSTGNLTNRDRCGNVQVLSTVNNALSDSQVLLVEQVTEAVVQSHLHTCRNTRPAVTQAWERLNSALPDLSNLSLSASTMWEQFTSNMAPEIAKAMAFCKSLPGFALLEPEDQMNLIKQGSFEGMLARFCMLVDHVNEIMIDPGHKMKCSKQVIEAMPMGAFLSEFFPIAARFNPLCLTDGELGLFTSVLFICPDREGLKSKDMIEKIQSLLQQSLYCLIRKNHAEPDNHFSKLMKTIPVFRAVNQKHSKALMAMKQKSPENYNSQFPSLHREVFH